MIHALRQVRKAVLHVLCILAQTFVLCAHSQILIKNESVRLFVINVFAGLKYRKNEVFLDVIESVNLLASANGNVLRSDIEGAIKMRVYLSGLPELRLGLNDKVLFENTGRSTKSKAVELEDVKFHQCVRYF